MNPSFFPAHESPRASGRGWGWLRWSLERSFDDFDDDDFDDDDEDENLGENQTLNISCSACS